MTAHLNRRDSPQVVHPANRSTTRRTTDQGATAESTALVTPGTRLTAVARVAKCAIDRTGAALLLALLAPLLIIIAVAIKTDGGPALCYQTRVGRDGRYFRLIKFRSMVRDADPRVTPVGAWLRKWSVDELPQLINVLAGSMSLVGPRPPLANEVESYSTDARRRLLVRPGLTGLCQISGRSDLTWEESVRLDLRYVENWSLALDAIILWKTLGAAVRPER